MRLNSNYILSDLINKINSGITRRLRYIFVSNTQYSLKILKLLYEQGLIRTFKVENDKVKVYFKYTELGISIIRRIIIVSTPGKRIYWTLRKLSINYNYHNFGGIYIISTSSGLVTSDYCLLNGRCSGEIVLKIEIL